MKKRKKKIFNNKKKKNKKVKIELLKKLEKKIKEFLNQRKIKKHQKK